MPQEKPFLVLLLTVVFVALGVLGLLLTLMLATVPLTEEMQLTVMVSAAVSIGYLVAAYGLYKGYRWGWILAAAFTVLNIVGNIFYGTYLALLIDAMLFVLLLLTAKHYGIPFFGKPTKPATPAPPPSAPVAAAFMFMEPRSSKRFVRKKH